MDPELLREIGEGLHGADWMAPLARDLDVSERTMRRWANGTAPMPLGLVDDLWRLVSLRLGALHELLIRLRTLPPS